MQVFRSSRRKLSDEAAVQRQAQMRFLVTQVRGTDKQD